MPDGTASSSCKDPPINGLPTDERFIRLFARMGLAPPKLEGRPGFPPGAGTAFGKSTVLSITVAQRTPPTSITTMQSPEKLGFFCFFFFLPKLGGGGQIQYSQNLWFTGGLLPGT